jgi:hypothetical protein
MLQLTIVYQIKIYILIFLMAMLDRISLIYFIYIENLYIEKPWSLAFWKIDFIIFTKFTRLVIWILCSKTIKL